MLTNEQYTSPLPPDRQPITVVTIDKHHLIRQGIRNLLAPHAHIELVGEGSTSDDVLTLFRTTPASHLISGPQPTPLSGRQY